MCELTNPSPAGPRTHDSRDGLCGTSANCEAQTRQSLLDGGGGVMSEICLIVTAQTLPTNTPLFSSVFLWRHLSAELTAASRCSAFLYQCRRVSFLKVALHRAVNQRTCLHLPCPPECSLAACRPVCGRSQRLSQNKDARRRHKTTRWCGSSSENCLRRSTRKSTWLSIMLNGLDVLLTDV